MIMYGHYVPMWKGPRLFHENARIICVFLPVISMDTVKKFYVAALHDTVDFSCVRIFRSVRIIYGTVRIDPWIMAHMHSTGN